MNNINFAAGSITCFRKDKVENRKLLQNEQEDLLKSIIHNHSGGKSEFCEQLYRFDFDFKNPSSKIKEVPYKATEFLKLKDGREFMLGETIKNNAMEHNVILYTFKKGVQKAFDSIVMIDDEEGKNAKVQELLGKIISTFVKLTKM